MESDIIDRMRREEAELMRKLEAVRSLLSAYGAQGSATPPPLANFSAQKVPAKETSAPKPQRTNEKLPLDRFGSYGRSVVKAAIAECRKHTSGPISSRDMVTLIEAQGIEVRGQDKANAVSALLARSIDLKPNGRKGWTLSDEFLESERRVTAELFGEENEPHSANAGGSETAQDAPTEETMEW